MASFNSFPIPQDLKFFTDEEKRFDNAYAARGYDLSSVMTMNDANLLSSSNSITLVGSLVFITFTCSPKYNIEPAGTINVGALPEWLLPASGKNPHLHVDLTTSNDNARGWIRANNGLLVVKNDSDTSINAGDEVVVFGFYDLRF